MNYLTHLYLSTRTPASFTGNMMGDFKPAPELLVRLPQEILQGIENHRLVDRTTDGFQPVKDLRKLFSAERRRYAGIVTDITFDYFLIKHWDQDNDGDFDDFTRQCYAGLAECEPHMPPRMALVTQQMRVHNWLSSYATLDGVGISIDRVSQRMRFPNRMAGAISEVEANYAEIEAVFFDLLAHLRAAIRHENIENAGPGRI